MLYICSIYVINFQLTDPLLADLGPTGPLVSARYDKKEI